MQNQRLPRADLGHVVACGSESLNGEQDRGQAVSGGGAACGPPPCKSVSPFSSASPSSSQAVGSGVSAEWACSAGWPPSRDAAEEHWVDTRTARSEHGTSEDIMVRTPAFALTSPAYWRVPIFLNANDPRAASTL